MITAGCPRTPGSPGYMFGQLPVWFADVLPVAPVAGCVSAGVVEELPVDPVEPVDAPVEGSLECAVPVNRADVTRR